MWIRGDFLCFLLSLLIAASVCHGGEYETVEVVGIGECADCAQNKIKTSQAFSGLRVTIDCKAKNGDFETRGVGELKEDGSFKVTLPQEILEDRKLKEECYAQLHSASATPCPAYNGLESSKIIFKSKAIGKHTFGLSGNLKFSPATCISAYLWPHYHKYPPLPKVPHYHKYPPLPKVPHYKYPPIHKSYPPFKHYGHHNYPLPPVYKKPLPPPVPIYKKPLPPPVPIYKKPLPPPVPIYKKPLPPPVPKYKKPLPPPLPPVYTHPPIPKVPVYKKPLPPPIPIHKPLPPFYKKPCPPLPKLPPVPKIPPKYFHHPKFGKWPPLPPLAPHHP